MAVTTIPAEDIALKLLSAEQLRTVFQCIKDRTGADVASDGHNVTVQVVEDGRPLATSIKPIAHLTVIGCYRLAATLVMGVEHLKSERAWRQEGRRW